MVVSFVYSGACRVSLRGEAVELLSEISVVAEMEYHSLFSFQRIFRRLEERIVITSALIGSHESGFYSRLSLHDLHLTCNAECL